MMGCISQASVNERTWSVPVAADGFGVGEGEFWQATGLGYYNVNRNLKNVQKMSYLNKANCYI